MTSFSLSPLPAESLPSWRAIAFDRQVELQEPALGPVASADRAKKLIDRLIPDDQLREDSWVWEVVDDESGRVGHVWLGLEQGNAIAYDVLLTSPATAGTAVRELVEREAKAHGAAELRLAVRPGDESSRAFADGGDFKPSATDMSLPLTAANLPEDQRISLRPMAQEQYDEFYALDVQDYADSRVKAGLETPEQALETSRQQFAVLLPDGQHTEHHQLWRAYDGNADVGMLWIDTSDSRAFVYNVAVEESQRRKGYGASIMNAGARWCQENGSTVLGLNVFGYNDGARALYEKLGYTVNQEFVQKPL